MCRHQKKPSIKHCSARTCGASVSCKVSAEMSAWRIKCSEARHSAVLLVQSSVG